MPHGESYSEQEDALIKANYSRMTLGQIAAGLPNRSVASVQQRAERLCKWGQLDVRTRYYQPEWAADDEEYLHENWGRLPDRVVCKRLRRTKRACEVRAEQLGITRHMNIWTVREVSLLFGVDDKTIIRWVERGWIVAHRSAVKGTKGHLCWDVDDASLETFVRTRHWALDWRLMRPGEFLTNIARDLWQTDPYLTAPEVCKELGWGRKALERWITYGLIPCQRRWRLGRKCNPWQGEVVVRRADLAGVKERHAAIVRANRIAGGKRGNATAQRNRQRSAA